MKERPILFTGPMVRAILEGRKTQTRRVLRSQPKFGTAVPSVVDRWTNDGGLLWQRLVTNPVRRITDKAAEAYRCPYGIPGDRLWVKETWMEVDNELYYRATDPGWDDNAEHVKWRPSIFMRREYSRINLEVLSVRVERVQDISPRDAWAEGVECGCTAPTPICKGNIDAFRALWDSINGKKPGRSWADNPWVWVIDFKREE